MHACLSAKKSYMRCQGKCSIYLLSINFHWMEQIMYNAVRNLIFISAFIIYSYIKFEDKDKNIK